MRTARRTHLPDAIRGPFITELLEERRLLSASVRTIYADPINNAAVDAAGNIYGSLIKSDDTVSVVKFDATTRAQSPILGPGHDNFFATDPNGNLFGERFLQGGVIEVYEIAAGTHTTTTIKTFAAGAQLGVSNFVADNAGDLFGLIVDYSVPAGGPYHTSIFKITGGSHVYSTVADFHFTHDDEGPIQMVSDSAGNLTLTYATDGDVESVYRIAAGSHTPRWVGKLDASVVGGNFFSYSFLHAADANGDVFGTAFPGPDAPIGSPSTIFKVSGGSTPTVTAVARSATFAYVLAVDPDGNLYGISNATTLFEIPAAHPVVTPLGDIGATAYAASTLDYASPGKLVGFSIGTPPDGTASISEFDFGSDPTRPPTVVLPTSGVNEGGNAVLSAAASPGSGAASIIKYEWDLNYDGHTFGVDSTLTHPTFSALGLDGPSTRLIAVRVTDSSNRVSTIATGNVVINNVSPTAVLSITPGGAGAATVVKMLYPADASPADVAAGFKYGFDFANDGSFTQVGDVNNSGSATASFVYAAGTHYLRGRIIDKNGGYSDYIQAVVIAATPPATASLVGDTFDDANANGTYEGGDTLTAGNTIFLDANNDGVLDTSERRTTSNNAGNWSFTGLAAGIYHVRRVFASGHTLSSPPIDITLTRGQQVSYLQIGSKASSTPPPPTGGLSGITYNDANANGMRDTGETAAPGKTVFLDLDADGLLDASETRVTTAADGTFAFAGLPAGTYHVRRVFPSGYAQSNALINVTLAAGQIVTGLLIGSRSGTAPVNTASIAGFAFNDVNRDGVFNTGDTLAAGKTIWLDLDDDGVIDAGEPSVVTDASGDFAFGSLAAGTYHVRRVFSSGYHESTPSRVIALTSGQAVTGVGIGSKN